MTSLIPNVNIGLRTKKSGRNVSCMVHGTSEIGYVYPTYCREYINGAKIKIGARTGVRFSPMFVPTMGKLNVRHYFHYVPYNRVYSAWDAHLAHEPYAFEEGSQIPEVLPSFKMGKMLQMLFWREFQNTKTFIPFNRIRSSKFISYLTCSIYKLNTSTGKIEPVNISVGTNGGLLDSLFRSYGSLLIPSFITNHGEAPVDLFYLWEQDSDLSAMAYSVVDAQNSLYSDYSDFVSNLSFPSFSHCDFMQEMMYEGTSYFLCYNYNGSIKRLRSIMLGLGYSFNLLDYEPDSILKLLAFYRTWFTRFGIKRDINFNDTNCAKISRIINSHYVREIAFDGILSTNNELFLDFITDFADIVYNCPPDYFTSSMQNIGSRSDITVSSVGPGGININAKALENTNAVSTNVDTTVNVLSLPLAEKLLSLVNTNNVVGRKIVDKLRALYGNISVSDESNEGVFKLGSDNTEIEIGAIFNQNGAGDVPLGSYAGVASGGKVSKYCKYTTDSFGVLIVLTAVIPEMGYYQGKLRENSDGCGDFLEHYNSKFDAVGWQTVRYNELIADRCYQASGMPSGTSLGAYGYQPRYSHLKVGFNRILGDISLPHMRDSMLAYSLDRYFNPRTSTLPVNSPYYMRNGTIGDTNRIFEVVSPTDDHVIYQIYFDIDVSDSMISLQNSYDTVSSEDNTSHEVSHE